MSTLRNSRLHELEIIIEEGKQAFMKVAEALVEIKETELYLSTHKTFGAYCKERWGFAKAHANHIIKAAEVVKSLPPEVATIVATESQARAIGQVPEEQRVAVMEKAQSIAKEENRPLRAKDIEAASPLKPFHPSDGGELPSPLKASVAPSYTLKDFQSETGGLVEIALENFTLEEIKKAAGELEMLAAKLRHKARQLSLTNSSQPKA